MSVNSSTTVFLNNIFVNNTFGEIDLDNSLLQRPAQPDLFAPPLDVCSYSTSTTAPIAIPNDHLSPYAANHYHLHSPISTVDDSFCLSPAADSDFLSAASPASSLCSFMAHETFLTEPYFQQDFCLNDPFALSTLQIADEEPFLSTPLSASPAPSASPALSYAASHHPVAVEGQEEQQRPRRRGPKLHKCPHCPHVSNRLNNMKEHILTHDPNRPKRYACHLCGKRFARKHDMKRHSKSPHSP